MSKETGKRAATQAAQVLRSSTGTAKEKSAAGSALTQRRTQLEETSARAASRASDVLRNPASSAAAKSAAASALAQRSKRGG